MSEEKTLDEKIIFIDRLIASTFSNKAYLYYLNIIDEYEEQKEEIERLNNIIKEAIEYIQDRYDGEVLTHTFDKCNVGELLEILDKENK